MQLLITGGLGFIGSNLVRHFLNTYPNYTVINLDAVTYAGHPENLADVNGNSRYKFVQGKIQDAQLVDELVSGKRFGPINGIINLAAESHVDRSIENPADFRRNKCAGNSSLARSRFPARQSWWKRSAGQSIQHPLCSSLDRRSLRLAGSHRLLFGRDATGAKQSIFSQQSRRRPVVPGLFPYFRLSRLDYSLFEQLRTLPTSGKANPAIHHELAQPKACTCIW